MEALSEVTSALATAGLSGHVTSPSPSPDPGPKAVLGLDLTLGWAARASWTCRSRHG